MKITSVRLSLLITLFLLISASSLHSSEINLFKIYLSDTGKLYWDRTDTFEKESFENLVTIHFRDGTAISGDLKTHLSSVLNPRMDKIAHRSAKNYFILLDEDGRQVELPMREIEEIRVDYKFRRMGGLPVWNTTMFMRIKLKDRTVPLVGRLPDRNGKDAYVEAVTVRLRGKKKETFKLVKDPLRANGPAHDDDIIRIVFH